MQLAMIFVNVFLHELLYENAKGFGKSLGPVITAKHPAELIMRNKTLSTTIKIMMALCMQIYLNENTSSYAVLRVNGDGHANSTKVRFNQKVSSAQLV